MLLVLPVQTFASAAMLGCAFSHQGQTSSPVLDKQVMLDEAVATCHEPEPSEKSPTSHNCKHCTACYLTSFMMVPAIDEVPILSFTPSFISHAEVTFIGFIPDSPERPPRHAFA